MWRMEYDDLRLVRNLSDLEKKQLPFATLLTLNEAMFDVREAWREAMPSAFAQPTPFTLNAVLYKKATKANLVADVFLRQEAGDSTAPARYLLPQATGVNREEKPFEYLLRKQGLIGPNDFVVPAKGFPLDAYGNVPGGVMNAILSDLYAQRDGKANSTVRSRGARGRRKEVKKRAVYFMSRGKGTWYGKNQHLAAGIFQRTSFGLGSSIRMVFVVVSGPPHYRKRFDGEALARKTFASSFARRFPVNLRRAVGSARLR